MPWAWVGCKRASLGVVEEVASCRQAFCPPGSWSWVPHRLEQVWAYGPHGLEADCLKCRSIQASHDEVVVHI